MTRTFALILCLSLSACDSKTKPAETPPPEAAQDTRATAPPSPDTAQAGAGAPGDTIPSKTPPTADFEKGSAKQLELLQGAVDQLGKDDFDNSVLFLLTLMDTPEKSPEKLMGLQLLGELYRSNGEPEKGLKFLLEAEPQFPPTAELKGSIAELYATTGKRDKALEYLRASLALDPSQLKYHVALVTLLKETGAPDFPQALTAYNTALDAHLSALIQPGLPTERIVEELKPLQEFRDPRVAAKLEPLLAHPDQMVVAETVMVLVQTANKDALPMLEKTRDRQTDAGFREALQQAIDILNALTPEQVQSIPEMPSK